MKYALLTLALFAVSCGKVEYTGEAGAIGTVRQLAFSEISPSDAAIFNSVCQALNTKSSRLEIALPTSLQFNVVQKDCDGNEVLSGLQQVRVEKSLSGEFQFRRQDTNSPFLFPRVETHDFGVMKELCAGASRMPILEGESAVWISRVGFTKEECYPSPNEVCLMVEKGNKEPNQEESYLIHSREFIRFNTLTTNGNYGYFTYRRILATNNCDQRKFTESSAELIR